MLLIRGESFVLYKLSYFKTSSTWLRYSKKVEKHLDGMLLATYNATYNFRTFRVEVASLFALAIFLILWYKK